MIKLKVYNPKNFNEVIKEIEIDNEQDISTSLTIGVTNVGAFRNNAERVSEILQKVNDVSCNQLYSIWFKYHVNGTTTGNTFIFYKNKMFFTDDFYKVYTKCPYCGKLAKIIETNRIRGSRKYERYGSPSPYYCNDCWNNVIMKNPIPYAIYEYHSYNRYVKFVKHKTKSDKSNCLQIGVELEIEFGNRGTSESNGSLHASNARKISQAAGPDFDVATSDMLLASYDCSLRNGFEIISQPMSLNYHKNVINWISALKTAHELGYKSHTGGHCGMHMHVNRDFFNGTRQEAEDKITVIVMNNKYWLVPFSRRKNWHYCSFPSSLRKLKGEKVVLSCDVKENKYINDSFGNIVRAKNDSNGHGSAMNFGNKNTIEFRFVRGTLLPGTFFASLEFVQMTCEMANLFTKEECANVNLQTYCLFARERGYKEFLNYVNKMDIKSSCKTILSEIEEDNKNDGIAKAKV